MYLEGLRGQLIHNGDCEICYKPSEYPICTICERIEELGSMLDNGCKNADKVQIRYDNLTKLRNTRYNH